MTLTLHDRATLKNEIRGWERRERNYLTYGNYLESPDNIWWDTGRLAYASTLTVTGSQTITEKPVTGQLEVSSIASISANDFNAVLFPRTISTGQKWRTTMRFATTSEDQFLMGSLLVSDGVTSTSNVAGNWAYFNGGSTNFITQGVGGTFTVLSSTTSATAVTSIGAGSAGLRRAIFLYELEYVSANTFSHRIFDLSGAKQVAALTSWSRTITPTHVGVGWSNWGNTPASNSITFGPVYRVA